MEFEPFKLLQTSRPELSVSDYNRLTQTVHQIVRSMLQQGFHDSSGFHNRLRALSAGETLDIELARITKTLQRADETVTPALEAVDKYTIKILSAAVWTAWSAAAMYYAAQKKVQHNGLDYKCLVSHYSSVAFEPGVNDSFWEEVETNAYVLGYPDTNLLETSPWFNVDTIVQVIKLPDYSAENKPIAGTEEWYIMETVRRVELVVDNEIQCSIAFNETEWREMSVF